MTDSQRSNSRVAVLDEAAVHTLLGDFFRQEIPTQLDAAFDVHVVRATRNLAETGATAAASVTPALIPAQRSVAVAPDTATRRFTVISALSALAACVTLVISVSSVSFPDGLVRKTRAIAPITSETELLLPVSENGGNQSAVIAPDGATLEEIDTIQLHPRQ